MPNNRFYCLDGMRGLAAFIVVVSHLVPIFYPQAWVGSEDPHYKLADFFSESIFFVLINGGFAVTIFFVLSGFVISMAASSTSEHLSSLIGRRYLRLAIPIIASVILANSLLILFPNAGSQAAAYLQNDWLVGMDYRKNTFRYDLAIWDGIYQCFQLGKSYINLPLWTMQIELFGSIAIYIAYKLLRRHWVPYFFVISIIVILFIGDRTTLYFLGFAFGGLLFEAYQKGFIKPSRLAFPFLAIGLFLGSYPTKEPVDTWLMPLIELSKPYLAPYSFILSIGALFTLLGLLMSPGLMRIFESRPLLFLGRISFSLYLLHWPIMVIAMLQLYLFFLPSGIYLFIYSLLVIVVCLMAGWLMTITIDENSVKLLSRLKNKPIRKDAIYISLSIFLLATTFWSYRVGFHAMTPLVFASMSFAFLYLYNATATLLADKIRNKRLATDNTAY